MAKRWSFGRKERSTVMAPTSPKEPQPLSTYHSSIDTLPLCRFIDCIVDNNLAALVITGEPNYNELRRAWSNILGEYSDAVGNAEYRVYVSVFKEVTELELKLSAITSAIDILRQGIYSRYLCDALNKDLRASFRFNYKDPASFQAEVEKAYRRSKAIKVQLDLKEMHLRSLEAKHTDGKRPDRRYYDAILVSLSDFAKYEITESITVSKFCERLKRYNAHCEQLKSRKNGR